MGYPQNVCHMDEAEKASSKPTRQQVMRLLEEFPRLDYLMAETLLMQRHEDLEKLLDRPATEK